MTLAATFVVPAVALDAQGNVIVAGPHGKEVDFGGGQLPWNGNFDVFAVKLDEAGSYTNHQTFGGAAHDTTWSIAVDAAGSVLMAASFSETVSLGSCPLTSAGATDILVAKLKL